MCLPRTLRTLSYLPIVSVFLDQKERPIRVRSIAYSFTCFVAAKSRLGACRSRAAHGREYALGQLAQSSHCEVTVFANGRLRTFWRTHPIGHERPRLD